MNNMKRHNQGKFSFQHNIQLKIKANTKQQKATEEKSREAEP